MYLALPDGAGGFIQDFSGPVLLRILAHIANCPYGGFTLYASVFQRVSSSSLMLDASPTTPHGPKPMRFGLIPFRSPLLRESRLFSFPTGTEMFQFPAFAPL